MTFWNKWVGTSNLVGLDIGSHTLKLAHLRPKKSGYELLNFSTMALPRGTVVDGDIIDGFTLEESLKELFAKEKVGAKEIALSISGQSVISKKITIPKITTDELEHQLYIIAGQYIPFPAEDIQVDYQLLPSHKDEAQKMDLIIVAVKQKLLESYKMVVEAADLIPKTVETASSALANLFHFLHPQEKNETSLLLHLGACWTQFVIIQKGVAVFSRDLTLGGNDITENLRENLKLSFSEAEALKIGSFKEKHLPQETLEIIERSGQSLCHEIQQSLNLYMSQHPDTQINKIYLSGGTSKIPPLRDWITEATGIETELSKPFERISYNKNRWQTYSIDDIEAISPIALGLATRSPKD